MKMKVLYKVWVLISLFFLISINAQSQDKNNPWVIGFGVNAVDFYPTNINGMKSENGIPTKWFDQFFNLNKHYNYIAAPSVLSLSRYLNESLNMDFSISVNKITELGSITLNNSVSYLAFDANLNYNINKIIGYNKWFEPFAIGGIGFNIKGANQNVLPFKNYASFNSGLGAKIWFNERLGIKGQSVYKHFFNDGSYPHFQHSISIIYKFGGYDEDNDGIYDREDKCPEVFGLKQFNGCPDTDGDGISDAEDVCPTVFGVKALDGCPDADNDGVTDLKDKCPYVKGVVNLDGCPDTDNDGIADQYDACPTVAGPQSNNGCPEPDTDGDGVIDKVDKCKFEAGPASNNGCPIFEIDLEKRLSELANSILFLSGSDQYYSQFEAELDEIAELMKKHNNLKFQIQGHTDNIGSAESNLKLSLRRVNTILNYLVSKGVNQFNLKVKGFGESMPITTNDTPDGRAKNRRVEIKIIK